MSGQASSRQGSFRERVEEEMRTRGQTTGTGRSPNQETLLKSPPRKLSYELLPEILSVVPKVAPPVLTKDDGNVAPLDHLASLPVQQKPSQAGQNTLGPKSTLRRRNALCRRVTAPVGCKKGIPDDDNRPKDYFSFPFAEPPSPHSPAAEELRNAWQSFQRPIRAHSLPSRQFHKPENMLS
ncbi:hypothetical protein F4813DRAFT_392861 [Daldinia decipiens]|uniref:uncharacterized protein n=1 Tax=Daldinia decipiens TaxID=326647 RepID=UPI0020C4CA1F|nr:uncharacterized protein F4813DRAFT_392861 [Daldinia decipiens]KAI1654356.1 hypothetical protein F4813DRAFT_392861 [Daldinia decipiens]